ncbi:hypothetical protein, partial [Klebsiella pneumoniae]|uniref:hypothetical protein n=1 Tax=Klebsiella pneumoniae TaxID=573 RepID=UPI0039C4030A
WYIGLAEPGKRTVKHNNKRNTTVKRESHSTLSESCVERVNKKAFLLQHQAEAYIYFYLLCVSVNLEEYRCTV